MAENEIAYRVSADNRDAERKLKETTRSTRKLGDVVDKTGDQAATAARQQREFSRATDRAGREADNAGGMLGKLRGQIGKVAAGWAGFGAAAAGAIVALRDIAQNAREARDALIELGQVQKGLSTNVGGKRADALRKDINRIARDKALGPQGRDQLIATATRATDLDPSLSNQEILSRVRGTASLSRATGFDPTKSFQAANALSENMDLGFGQAVDQAAVLGTSGFSAKGIQQVGERFAGLEGRDVLTMLMAARQQMDPNAITEGLNTLRNALTRRNDQGQLVEGLRNLGISGDQSFTEQIRTIRKGMEAGQITEADLEALGGTRAQGVLKAFTRAVPRLDDARQSLESTTVEDLIEKQRQSEVVRAAERSRRRKLRSELATEESGMGGAAEAVSEAQTRLEERGGGSAALGAAERNVSGSRQISGGPPSAAALEAERKRRASQIPLGTQRLGGFADRAVERARQNLRNELEQLAEQGQIDAEAIDTALGRFDVAVDNDMSVFQSVTQARSPFESDDTRQLVQETITGSLQGGPNVNVTINNTENNAQQFNGAKDPDTGDLDAATKGERPD
jgi:hypothetical protein